MSLTAKIELPPKLVNVFSGDARYRGAYGGRGSGKTRSFALMTAVRGYMFAEMGVSGVILCGREHLNSLEESSLEEVKAAIRSVPWLDSYYEIGEKYIRTKNRRVKYIFSGLHLNVDSLKSKSRIIIAWIDEAEGVSEIAWRKLIPTVRAEGVTASGRWESEIWVTWNPESPDSATHKRFRVSPPENSKIVELNFSDNPWFPSVIDAERRYDLAHRPDIYDHIWLGEMLSVTDAQVFSDKYEVSEFEPGQDWDGPYFGLDFGFSQDPTAANEVFVHDGSLYIRREVSRRKLELDDTARLILNAMPEMARETVRADSSRPESISFLQRHGIPRCIGVKKWPGSVMDGIEVMRSFRRIYIHPDCKSTAREFRLYSYKVDKRTDEVTTTVIDNNNHHIDAIRYAIAPFIQARSSPRIRVL